MSCRVRFLRIPAALALAIVACDFAACGGAKPIIITDKDSKVQLAKGDTLALRLPANPTTGFSWTIAKNDDAKLKSAGKPEFEPPDKKVVGAGGTQIFRFTAEAAGEFELELHYKRPFEKDKDPAKTHKVKVTIK